MRTFFALLAATIVVWAGETDAKRVRDALDSGSWRKVIRYLDGDPGQSLGKEPELARGVCRRAADKAFQIANGGLSGEEAVEAFEKLGEALAKHGSDDANAVAARAEIRLLRARFLRSSFGAVKILGMNDSDSPAAFQDAAKLFAAAHALDTEDSRALARAVLSLIEGAWAAPESRAEALARAEEYAKLLETEHGKSSDAALARSALLLETARVRLSTARKSTEVKEVRSAIESVFAHLAPYITGRTPDIEIPTLYNEAVAFALAHRKKLRLDAEFRADEWSRRYLETRLPRSRLVVASRSIGNQIFGEVYQWRADGRGFRHFVMFQYKWSKEYTTGPRGIGGDNPKGLLQGNYDDDVASLKRKTRNRRIVKGRLNRSIRSGYEYEIIGADRFGQTIGYRGFCFKAERHKVTLQLWIEELCFDSKSKIDPVGEFIVQSMRETR